jgi:FMN phosphatase YigB (HAD superfamily)
MNLDPASIDAVVFDIGGVFLYPGFGPVAGIISDLGLALPDDESAYRAAHHAGVRALSDSAVAVRERDRDFWTIYDYAYGRALGVGDEHLPAVSVAMRQTWDWAHTDNIAAFHALAASGMPVAVVSNNDGTAADQLLRHGVCQVGPGELPSVAAIVDSTEVGVWKPHPEIFTPALEALGVPAGRALYVGDTHHADVVGAMAADMQVVQLDPFDHHIDLEHHRVPDLMALNTVLGVG